MSAMKPFLSLMVLALTMACSSAAAADFCERLPMDPELPAGFGGSYEVIGKDPRSGEAYTGTLVLGYGPRSYTLTRRIHGRTVHGEAWLERCGADKVQVLMARYNARPMITLLCTLGADSDIRYRITCQTRQGESPAQGLEAWFQRP